LATEFKLPELGENVAAGDVIRVLVSPGDQVTREQPLLELETDKATIEVPSTVSGRVTAVAVKAGDKVKVGQVILSIEESNGAGPVVEAATSAAVEPPASALVATADADADAEPSRARRGEVVDINRAVSRPVPAPEPARDGAAEREVVPAAPSVRRLARELGVDIARVSGTGPGGRIGPSDVKEYAKAVVAGAAGGRSVVPVPLPDFSRWGDTERQPMSGIRRKTAEHTARAWATIPHVTQHDVADITDLEALRKRYATPVESAGGKLTITAIALKVAAAALRRFPQFNTSVDAAREEIVLKGYVHIGVAVDTERGLLVPVIRDVDQKSLTTLAVELAQVSARARARKLSLEEMEGGSFTITNLGGIGGTGFSPIVNAPEVAILGLARARTEAVWIADRFEPRLRMPVSLSYDHRVIDGADAARFLRWIAEALEQPFVWTL